MPGGASLWQWRWFPDRTIAARMVPWRQSQHDQPFPATPQKAIADSLRRHHPSEALTRLSWRRRPFPYRPAWNSGLLAAINGNPLEMTQIHRKDRRPQPTKLRRTIKLSMTPQICVSTSLDDAVSPSIRGPWVHFGCFAISLIDCNLAVEKVAPSCDWGAGSCYWLTIRSTSFEKTQNHEILRAAF